MVIKEVAADLEALRLALQQARSERPSRPSSLKDVIQALTTEIDDLLKARWTYREITDTLVTRGVEISMGTLQQYHREAKRGSEDAANVKARMPKVGRLPVKVVTPPAMKSEPLPAKAAEHKSELKAERKPKLVPNAASAVPTQRKVNDDA